MNDQISFSSNRNTIQKFKVVLVGDQSVGKSSIISRYIRNEFDPTKNPTIGIDFISKNIAVSGKMIRLQLWDTAGQ
jgi:small GTP-binding protein